MEGNTVFSSVSCENIGNTLTRGNDVKYIYARGNVQSFVPEFLSIAEFLAFQADSNKDTRRTTLQMRGNVILPSVTYKNHSNTLTTGNDARDYANGSFHNFGSEFASFGKIQLVLAVLSKLKEEHAKNKVSDKQKYSYSYIKLTK